MLCLALHEERRHRKSCQTMLAALAQIADASAANLAAWTCSLAPDSVDDYDSPIALASKAVEARPESDQALNALGAVLYRAGRHGEAIERLAELDRRLSDADGASASSPAYTWYCLAMAHKKAGDEEQAREYLKKANAWTDKVLADKTNPPAWNRRATLEILRKEAEALLGPDDEKGASEQKPKPDSKT
jgi:tetratricopeptide (TPR) repeat protein